MSPHTSMNQNHTECVYFDQKLLTPKPIVITKKPTHIHLKIKKETLNDIWVQRKVMKEIRKYLELNENKNTIMNMCTIQLKPCLQAIYTFICIFKRKKS